MSRSKAGRPRPCLARCASWLGFDRNPLRRPTDRVEAAIRLITAILFLAAVPIAVIAVGRQTDHVALQLAHAQQAAEHQVSAVLLQQAQATGIPDPDGARAGSTVTVWVGSSGALASPPPDHRDIAGIVTVAVVVTTVLTSVLLLESNALARRVLNRRRLNALDAEWRATGPMWTDHLS
jgi:hypothetical protein